RSMIFYESPFRVLKALKEFAEAFGGERRVSVSRELTKKFEQTVRGSLTEVIAHFEATPPKGEFVMIVEGCDAKHATTDNDEAEDE
ncbi:MAG: 16S rRNA (cytidine(1402)-2'-O)-methyltransferase, partial [Tidjanibacter sp.]|nr:16S rRNA (cytidine(1402)-2'-O)-methyltransferase [Tidjanibacter sp.]